MKAAHRIAASLAGAALLVALGVALSFWSFRQIREAAEERAQTDVVIKSAGDLLSALKDAETGQRGYLLTGNDAFLEPYAAVRDHIRRHLEELRQLALSSAAHKHLDALALLVAAKMAELSHVIELRRNQDMTGALAAVGDGLGKRLMDSIRVEMGAFIQIEEDARAQHDGEFRSDMRRLFTIIAAASLLMLLLALSFAYLIYRETQHRLQDQVHLETKHLLEIRGTTNKQLQQANVTLQASEEKLAVTLNSIGDAVIATDAEGRVTRLNPLAEQLTGWTQAQATGRPVDEIFHVINQETRQPAIIPVKEALACGTIHGVANHTVLIALGGSECPIADSCAPIRDRDGQVVGAVLVFRDVTKEYAARQTLLDNAALIQTILNTVADGIITFDAGDGIVGTVNPAAERMFGYPAADLIRQKFSLLIPDLDRNQRNGPLDYYNGSDEARAIGLGREVVGRRKDGSHFPVELAVSEMWLGSQRYFTGILRDVTTRKHTQEALRQQAMLFDQLYDPAIVWNWDGPITFWNRGAERLYGFPCAVAVGRVTHELLRTKFPESLDACLRALEQTGQWAGELENVTSDGRTITAETRMILVRESERTYVLEANRDITGRKLAEKTVMKLAAIVEFSDDAMIGRDLDGNIQSWNAGAEKMFGYSAAEMVGGSMMALIPVERLEEEHSILERLKRGENVPNLETVRLRKDRSRVETSITVSPIKNSAGKVVGASKVARDITGRKAAEAKILQLNLELEQRVAERTAELQSANQELEAFSYSVSHDLRAPLRHVTGFVSLLKNGAGPSLSQENLGLLTDISEAATRMGTLIDDLLNFSRVGKSEMRKTNVNLADLVRETLGDFQAETRDRQIDWKIGPLPDVWADPALLRMALVNLISNAVKFTGARAKARIEIACAPGGARETVISIRDNGAGFDPQYADKLFGVFQRLHDRDEFEGTGIGLANVQRIIHRHSGRTWAEGIVDSGATFYFSLPKQNGGVNGH